jgi:hypothetical protein
MPRTSNVLEVSIRKFFGEKHKVNELKNISQIEHSSYRSPVNFVLNLVRGLIAIVISRRSQAWAWW